MPAQDLDQRPVRRPCLLSLTSANSGLSKTLSRT